MNFFEEAEKHLNNPKNLAGIMKGLGYALLANVQETKNSNKRINTLTQRKPVPGDVMTMYCHSCGEDVAAYTETLFDDLFWICPKHGAGIGN